MTIALELDQEDISDMNIFENEVSIKTTQSLALIKGHKGDWRYIDHIIM